MLPNETIPDDSVLAEHPPRMTKRIKTFKPKVNLTKAEVQSLSDLLKDKLDDLEYRIHLNTEVAMTYKRLVSDSDGYAQDGTARYFAKVRKCVAERNRIAKIQHKLKRLRSAD